MMLPPPASIILGTAYLVVSIMLFRFTSSTLSHTLSSTSVGVPGPVMPTLLNRTCSAP